MKKYVTKIIITNIGPIVATDENTGKIVFENIKSGNSRLRPFSTREVKSFIRDQNNYKHLSPDYCGGIGDCIVHSKKDKRFSKKYKIVTISVSFRGRLRFNPNENGKNISCYGGGRVFFKVI